MLDKIVETKKEEVKSLSLPEKSEVKPVSFYQSLKNSNNKVALIAEVKKASPSKGVIREDFNPIEIAKGYEEGGADAVSVLTDRQYFQGAPEYLTSVKQHVHLPVIRKDFIIDSLQIEESKRIGADAILLIAEVLEPNQLFEFYQQAAELGMDSLVEVHSQEALEGILSVFTPKIIGVNNRNLKTFETSLEQTKEISQFIPDGSLFISESGIHTTNDLETVCKAGASGVLVGESLMRATTPKEGIRKLYGGLNQR